MAGIACPVGETVSESVASVRSPLLMTAYLAALAPLECSRFGFSLTRSATDGAIFGWHDDLVVLSIARARATIAFALMRFKN